MTTTRSGRLALILAAGGLLSALALLGGCATNPVTGVREMILVPRDQEIAMGEESAPQFEQEFGGRVPNAALQAYVQSVGKKLAAVSDREMPYEYALVASDVPNAFALPGGKIYITAGLMARISNERQLAAVLGHETGHVAALHSVKGLQREVGASVLVELASRIVSADKADAAQAAAKVVTALGTLKYSRDDEYQADQIGIKYAARAGYNPWGMVELLTVLKNMSDSEPGTFGEMLQTHPLSSKRIAEAEAMIKGNAEYAKFSPTAPDPQAAHFIEMRRALEKTVPAPAK